MKITFIRHPQTTANMEHLIYGKTDYPYTKRGENQLLWLKDYMAINYELFINDESIKHMKIISSPRKRALDLAMAIGDELGIRPEVNNNIQEMNFGIFEGLTAEEAMEKYPDEYQKFNDEFETFGIPQGDSYDDFLERLENFIDELSKLLEEGDTSEVIIVTHGGVVRDLLEQILNMKPGDSWKFVVGNGCIIKLDLYENEYKLKELIANKF